MILDEVKSAVSAQLDDQAKLGVKIVTLNDVPETGPVSSGVWFRIPSVTAVFADLNSSTKLNFSGGERASTLAYTYFQRAMTVALERFSAKYVEVQGDGVFGLFGGKGSMFNAAACAVTMRTLIEDEVSPRFRKDASSDWQLTAGVGIDHGTLLVRRLGLKGTSQNEVWADEPVNVAAKLSSLADANQIVISDRLYDRFRHFAPLRKKALLMSCGCSGERKGRGFNIPVNQIKTVWEHDQAPSDLGTELDRVYTRNQKWCATHGAAYCEALITNKIPGG